MGKRVRNIMLPLAVSALVALPFGFAQYFLIGDVIFTSLIGLIPVYIVATSFWEFAQIFNPELDRDGVLPDRPGKFVRDSASGVVILLFLDFASGRFGFSEQPFEFQNGVITLILAAIHLSSIVLIHRILMNTFPKIDKPDID